jgi:putative membrane protein
MRILIAVLLNALALLATTIVPGIVFTGSLLTLVLAGAIFGVFNAIVKPLAVLLSLPLIVVTLGIFYLILNGILLWLASFVIPGYVVAGIVPGILGSLVLTIFNWLVGALGRK